jgi:hypothetical protein
VPVDISGFYDFFASPAGGNWCSEEMDILLNPPLRSLLQKIEAIATADYDYVITFFSGHGSESDDGTVLSINGRSELIMMNALTNLSQRQLLILDCCRSPMPPLIDTDFTETGATKLSMSRDPLRRAYEDRLWDSIPQEVILYACDEGEKSTDTPYGGNYSQYLLYVAEMLSTDSVSPFVSVSEVHFVAASLMRRDNLEQRPQIIQPRCALNRQLPLVVGEEFFL